MGPIDEAVVESHEVDEGLWGDVALLPQEFDHLGLLDHGRCVPSAAAVIEGVLHDLDELPSEVRGRDEVLCLEHRER